MNTRLILLTLLAFTAIVMVTAEVPTASAIDACTGYHEVDVDNIHVASVDSHCVHVV